MKAAGPRARLGQDAPDHPLGRDQIGKLELDVHQLVRQVLRLPSNLAVAAASLGSFLYINDTHGTAWTWVAAVSDRGGGEVWNDLIYVTNTQAWVVYGPADTTGPGQLWDTHDAGRHWTIAKL